MKKPTKKQYEEYLNSISPSQDSEEWIIGGVPRFYYKYLNQYGTAIRKYDKIGFQVGYNEYVLSKKSI
tara:strand:+ start:2955 stop:3158 length:204 start_codon:yes stop_codon:yes gene_type:complete